MTSTNSENTTASSNESGNYQEPVFLHGSENPFYQFAVDARTRVAGLKLSGEAQIPKATWQHDYGQGRDTRTMTYEEITNQGRGWKFHLNFDPDNDAEVQQVGDFLTALKDEDIIHNFKIGHGGGKYWDQPGKEATVYVGHKDKADVVATIIEEGIGNSLAMPEDAALKDDISFTNHVMGRFTPAASDAEFHQYGVAGHPILNDDMAWLLFNSDTEARKQHIQESAGKADQILRERYGVFYTGTTQPS